MSQPHRPWSGTAACWSRQRGWEMAESQPRGLPQETVVLRPSWNLGGEPCGEAAPVSPAPFSTHGLVALWSEGPESQHTGFNLAF